jgi:hypothetical protein
MRLQFELSFAEVRERQRLLPNPGVLIEFWAKVANARSVDRKTIISEGIKFSALPLGHDKHWCWPIPLKCKKKPVYRE